MDKREQIISTAIELFAHSGFDNTSIRELSRKAGVNVAMINYYFGSKEKLFEAMIEHKANYLREKLEELYANAELDEMEKISIIIETYVTRIILNPLYHRVLHQEMLLKVRPEVNAAIFKIFSKNSQIIRKILEDGMEKNLFRKVDTDLTIASVIGTISHVMLSPTNYCHMEPEDLKDPEKNEILRTRIINHLQQLMKSHLLNHNNL